MAFELDRDLSRVNIGVERMPKYESAQKADPVEENSPAVLTGTRTRDLLITSPALGYELSLLPWLIVVMDLLII